ncbi:major facilitator superfamily domain-containing protein [Naematelia encephala]|uniref:Major facilitator superfamily domain-containing protein n=1 Tax=Naematelia encephala TaxID=71784 RepID=A0A1Y2BAB9_9TREE|nr:major facilitator superfamily domain-containing protein [Naematelia encephala]
MGATTADRGPTVFTVTLVMLIVATVMVLARLVSKWGVTKRRRDPDDWLVLLAWTFTVALSTSIINATRHGLGKPDDDISNSQLSDIRRNIYVFTVFYNPALMATKSAILVLYIRMAAAHPFLRYASWGVMGVVDLAGVVLTFLNLFPCRPLSAAFSDDDGKCIDLVSLYLSSAPINVLTDLAILLLPLPILTRMRMEWRQKVILVATFIVGGFVTIFDVIRIAYLQSALKQELRASLASSSVALVPRTFIYDIAFSLMWSAVEVSVGLCCACVLVLKPLVMRVLPSMLRGSHEKGGTTRNGETLVIVDEQRLSDDISQSPRSPKAGFTPTFPQAEIPQPEPQTDENTQAEDGNSVDFFDMLANGPEEEETTPPMPSLAPAPTGDSSMRIFNIRRQRKDNLVSSNSQEPSQTFFDFVNMNGKKPLTELSAREAWWPVLFVSILFFMWGFAYGLLGTLTSEIQQLLDYSPSRTIALHNAYWAAYAFGPPVLGYWVLSRHGFKPTFITGLAVFAIGSMSFWPSSVLKSYAGFFISNFIIGFGLCILEVAANPFIVLAGPGELSEARLNFSQGIQGIGSVLSPILARKALFRNVTGETLFDVQWCYLAVALFVVALAVVFFYVPLSEASDTDLELATRQRIVHASLDPDPKLVTVPLRHLILGTSIFAMFCYVGAQESTSYFWGPIVGAIRPTADPFWTMAIGHSVFAVGRFLASFLCWIRIPPRLVLAFFVCGAFITSLLTLLLPPSAGALGVLLLTMFFESAIFPTIFAMALRNQGRNTKLASTGLTTAISGGCVIPSITYGVDHAHSNNPRFSLRVNIALYAFMLLWAVGLSGRGQSRRWLDPCWSRQPIITTSIEQTDGQGTAGGGGELSSAQLDEFESKGPKGLGLGLGLTTVETPAHLELCESHISS